VEPDAGGGGFISQLSQGITISHLFINEISKPYYISLYHNPGSDSVEDQHSPDKQLHNEQNAKFCLRVWLALLQETGKDVSYFM